MQAKQNCENSEMGADTVTAQAILLKLIYCEMGADNKPNKPYILAVIQTTHQKHWYRKFFMSQWITYFSIIFSFIP